MYGEGGRASGWSVHGSGVRGCGGGELCVRSKEGRVEVEVKVTVGI